jgi:hypothetical protein
VNQVDGQLLPGLPVGQAPGHVAEESDPEGNTSGHGRVVLGLAGQPEKVLIRMVYFQNKNTRFGIF